MATHQTEHLSKTKVKITITVPASEQQPYLDRAAAEISKEAEIAGFRPGFAPYRLVAAKVGPMAILEAAIPEMVRGSFVSAVVADGLSTVGSPEVNVTKAATGNDVVFEAVVGLMPNVVEVAAWKTLKKARLVKEVSEKELDTAMGDLARMQTKETRAASGETAGNHDKVVADLSMTKDGIIIEGGTSKGAIVIMDQNSYLHGLKEGLLGGKEGEDKFFTVTFPKEHYQKHLAGSPVEVKAHVTEIYHLETPPLDDTFAVSLGFKTLAELRAKIAENITAEKIEEGKAAEERAILEELAKKSHFDEIPEALVSDEMQKMAGELRREVTENGLEFNEYLHSIKKTLGELLADLRPQAETRVKVALLLREIARQENIAVSSEEIEKELDRIASMLKDADAKTRVFSPEYREYQEAIMRNRRVIDLLCKTVYRD